MVVGLLTIDLQVCESESLKDKRQVVRSLVDRIRSRFNVSVSQVDRNNHWQLATIAVACVTSDARFANEVLNKVVHLVESEPRAEVTHCQMEML